jgi:hypothetical protein
MTGPSSRGVVLGCTNGEDGMVCFVSAEERAAVDLRREHPLALANCLSAASLHKSFARK